MRKAARVFLSCSVSLVPPAKMTSAEWPFAHEAFISDVQPRSRREDKRSQCEPYGSVIAPSGKTASATTHMIQQRMLEGCSYRNPPIGQGVASGPIRAAIGETVQVTTWPRTRGAMFESHKFGLLAPRYLARALIQRWNSEIRRRTPLSTSISTISTSVAP